MSLEALIFDVDGTLADTEDVHRRAFNLAFREHGLDWNWNASLYDELLQIAGGKERITHYIDSCIPPCREADRLRWLVPRIHRTKTLRYAELVDEGEVALRPGVERLISEALDGGLKLAIASTTTLANVRALIVEGLGFSALASFDVIASGDAVSTKKPAPDIYNYALERLRLRSGNCIAFEDSEIGLRAAKSAGLCTVITPTRWTRSHCFEEADLVLPTLGDIAVPLDDESARRLGADWLSVDMLGPLLDSRLVRSGVDSGFRLVH